MIGAVLTPLVFFTLWLLPLPLPAVAQRMLAIVGAVVVAWVTEVVPVSLTSLLIAPLMVAMGITSPERAFSPYADPLLFLFYGAFFIAEAMRRHGLDRRLASQLLSSRVVAGIPSRLRVALLLATLLLSMWISNTASAAMLLPLVLGALDDDPKPGGARRPPSTELRASLLIVAYGASIGGMGTVIGTPPNMITVRLLSEAGVHLGFLDWLAIGVPTAVVLMALLYFLLKARYPTGSPIDVSALSEHTAALGPWTRAERLTALSFGLAVLGWVVPPVIAATGASFGKALNDALPPGSVALIAAAPLFFLRERPGGGPVLPWASARQIDWGIIMLYGGGITLGAQMFETGLARVLGRGFLSLTGVTDIWTLTAVAIVFTALVSEVCSNTAAANMLIPLVIGIATELGVSPIPPALGVGLGATCGFMLPIATGPNALAFGTGRLTQGDMIRTGLLLDLLCCAGILLVLRILCPLMGWV